ncbi:MAG: ATP-dependent protease, partial [Bacteroidetes bacterium]|nr:ATP-dependent protease [Bacteroidota bacterium]
SSLEIKKRVQCSRNIQKNRFKSIPGVHCNGQMSSSEIEKYCHLDDTSLSLLRNSMEKLALSARAYHRILKIARTIADMNKQERINNNHLAEAIQFRRLQLL